jgi:DNA repair protein RecN (Recombination protein N)
MLKELSIRNFAIVEQIHVSFEQGFHVLTGETGAGKSMIIDALGLLIGGRASSDFVRYGATKAVIEASFELDEHHPAVALLKQWDMDIDEDLLLVRREITASGKSTCRVNGQMITLAMLKQLGYFLIQIHGQHEHTGLLHVEEHLAWLDAFGGEALLAKRQAYETQFREYQAICKQLAQLDYDRQEIERRIDMLQFQVEEISAARLVPGEAETLQEEERRLAGGEKLLSRVSSAYQLLSAETGGIAQVRRAAAYLQEVSDLDPAIAEALETVETASFQLEEAARDLDFYQDNLDFSPQRLYEVQERMHLIRQLQRKYGENVEDILAYLSKAEAELDRLLHMEEDKEHLYEQKEKLRLSLIETAKELTTMRKQVAKKLEVQVKQQLEDLMMGATLFHVSFAATEDENFRPTGCDQVEFQLAPGPGEPLRPLAKIASGGELSRIMLALKCIFSGREHVHTLIFDEVDTGVSGRAAQAIAEKIATLAKENQILCVTHLPQVACMADVHFYVSKQITEQKTSSNIHRLDKTGRIGELSRMLGGAEVTARTKQHAAEMLFLANRVKAREENIAINQIVNDR